MGERRYCRHWASGLDSGQRARDFVLGVPFPFCNACAVAEKEEKMSVDAMEVQGKSGESLSNEVLTMRRARTVPEGMAGRG